jgi:hypothetical protein
VGTRACLSSQSELEPLAQTSPASPYLWANDFFDRSLRLGSNVFTQDLRGLGLPRAQTFPTSVPSIDGFDRDKIHVVICQEHVLQVQSEHGSASRRVREFPLCSETYNFSLTKAR